MNATYDDASYLLDSPLPAPSTLRQFSAMRVNLPCAADSTKARQRPPPPTPAMIRCEENQGMTSYDCIGYYVCSKI
jgi:hypothetical protein